MSRRLLSAALACSIMITGFTAVKVSAASEDGSVIPESQKTGLFVEEAGIIERTGKTEYSSEDDVLQFSTGQAASLFSFFGSGNNSTRNYYDILTDEEKGAYDLIKSAIVYALSSDSYEQFVQEIKSNGVVVANGVVVSMGDIRGIAKVHRAYCALVADHPEYFWLANILFSYSNTSTKGDETDIDIVIGRCADTTDGDIISKYNRLMNEVDSIVSEAGQYSSDYDKIKYFATYISDRMTYNNGAATQGNLSDPRYANCWNAYGALINGNGVCEAYAEAFKLLCDGAGIPCISVYSGDHEWNAVMLEGKWYYVDVTWIDTDSPSTYRYDTWLAVGTDSAEKNDNTQRSHTPVPDAILSTDTGSSGFTYPAISKTDYSSDSVLGGGSDSEGGSGSGENSGTGSGTDTDISSGDDIIMNASNSSGIINTASGIAIATKNKTVTSLGATNYKFTVLPVSPVINVSVPSKISIVINPYSLTVGAQKEDSDLGVITSSVYTVRNKTKTSAVKVSVSAYLTVPKDKNGPTIAVCNSPDEVRNNSGKAITAYLLTYVSENSVTASGDEAKNLVEANNVQYAAGQNIVFADATVDKKNSSQGTLMIVPKANYLGNTLKDYYYGHFIIGGEVSSNGTSAWAKKDKVKLMVVFNVVPCADPS